MATNVAATCICLYCYIICGVNGLLAGFIWM